MGRKSDQAGTFELLAKLPQQVVTLARLEYENAKREIARKAKRGGIGALAIVVALFFLFWAIAAFVAAAIAGISVVWPVWLSALVVGVGLLLLAAAAIFAGIALIKRGIPVPEEAIGRVEEDLSAMGEVRFNASAAPQAPQAGRAPRTPSMPKPGEEGNWR